MCVRNRLTKYKLKLSLNFLQRLWTDSRSYFEWPSNGGPCSHCIFENKLLYAVVCISALYLDQLQSRHSPGTSTQGQTSVPNDAVLHFTPPRAERGHCPVSAYKSCSGRQRPRRSLQALAQASSAISNLSLHLSLSVLPEKQRQQFPVPQCCSEASFHKVLLQSLRKGTIAVQLLQCQKRGQRRAPHSPETPMCKSRGDEDSHVVTLLQPHHSSSVFSHSSEKASHFQISRQLLGCPISQAVPRLHLLQWAKLRVCGRGLPLPSEGVSIQHLQQQVVHWHHVFTLHAQQMLHSFVTVQENRK